MPDWLAKALFDERQAPLAVVAVRCAAALAAGAGVAWVYMVACGRHFRAAAPMVTTLTLLAALVALVTQVIGDNTARAFGLVGVLSIVRFRSNVEDTRDTAFVIFAVVLGMAIGAGQALVALVGLIAVGAAAFALAWLAGDHGDADSPYAGALKLRCAAGVDPAAVAAPVFATRLAEHRLLGAEIAGKGTAVEATFQVTLNRRAEGVALILDLQKLEGVLSAELRPNLR